MEGILQTSIGSLMTAEFDCGFDPILTLTVLLAIRWASDLSLGN